MVLVVAYTAIAPNFDQAFINYAFASAVIFLFVTRSGARAWTATVAAAAGFSVFHAFFKQGANIPAPPVSLYAGMLGRGAMVVLGWRAIWASPQESRRLLRISLLPVGIVLFVLGSLVALNLTVQSHPRVLDPYLYVFDGSLGFQPSFLIGQVFLHYKGIGDLVRATYFGLPVAIALACAGYLNRSPWRPLGILASAGVLGYLLYFAFPAAGPRYIAGLSFPGSPHPFATLGQIHPRSIDLPIPAPRNAMPSLHMAWVLLVWFNCRPFPRVSRALALAYVLLTVAATLGTGEHYLADLAVALPFSVAVQALWTDAPGNARYSVLASMASLTLAWLVALRYGTHFFLLSAAIPWACVIASTVISLALERLLVPLGSTRSS
jgi:PAP2 superfamily protein